jgi:hypothetical protein
VKSVILKPIPKQRAVIGWKSAIAGLALSIAVGGCATPAGIMPGTSAQDVVTRLGPPVAEYRMDNGIRRLEYSGGGLQQEAWMVDVDRDGRVIASTQVHTLQYMMQVPVGAEAAEVRRRLGAPWKIQHYRLSGVTAWLYPHVENGLFNSMMGVMFDAQGKVQRVENGPDPRFLGGDDFDL